MWVVIKQRKITSVIIALLLLGGGYYGYRKITIPSAETHYVLAVVQKSTLITSVSGTGQIAVSNQVEVKSKVSGDIIAVPVENGQAVKAGTVLARLDAKDAQKAVRDAAANLESAKIALAKLKQPADAYSILQAENSLEQANETKRKTEDDLNKLYDDGYIAVANAFLDFPTIMTGLQDILLSSNFGNNQWNMDYYAGIARIYDEKIDTFRDDAFASYKSARVAYDANFIDYKKLSRSDDSGTIEAQVAQTHDTAKLISDAVKSANNLIQFYRDKLTERNLKPQALSDTHLVSLNGFTGKTNTHITNLLNITNGITNDNSDIINAERVIKEKTESLVKLKAGAEELDIQSQELSVKQRANALLDAQEKLADYIIRAPFEGIAAKVNIKKSDSVSANASIVTLITAQQMAQISLNEVDAAKIKIGEKSTLIFDAVPGVSITGEVAEIDTLGTVSQGVVTYAVKIVFDTQDARIKPGMTVSAAIITNAKPDALLAPISAVKTHGDISYVEVFDRAFSPDELSVAMKNSGITLPIQPRRQKVETGISNDVSTEIISGLKEGDVITARIIAPAAPKTATQQAPSLFGAPATRGAGGGSASRGAGR